MKEAEDGQEGKPGCGRIRSLTHARVYPLIHPSVYILFKINTNSYIRLFVRSLTLSVKVLCLPATRS